MLRMTTLGWVFALSVGHALVAQQIALHPSFEILRRRMDVDVDGAPTAYGPKGKHTLDYLKNARLEGKPWKPIVGYLTENDSPHAPVVQGPHDPAPGYYISQTAYTDKARTDERDEGSLHLLQALGYPFHDGKQDAVEEREIVVRFYPGSNPEGLFFCTQTALDESATKMGLSRDFSGSLVVGAVHPK